MKCFQRVRFRRVSGFWRNQNLDTSVYNRPFDDQSQPRIILETLALTVILQLIANNNIELISSAALMYENSKNPYPIRQKWVSYCMGYSRRQAVDENIKKQANALEGEGIKAMDALHVASAEAAECDYFLTCDDRILKRYQGTMKVKNPIEFVYAATEKNNGNNGSQ
ncbi:MAG: type II toxin-antitoxin system VapC family toxin [Gammaproteobacteria bacterium]|nr:type II toxin-antitoxin system VapC family toxin [Gammaproteobacteria bacterium]